MGQWPESYRDLVCAAVQEFVTGQGPDKAGLKPLAQAFQALPVYADMGGALLLKPNGEVLTVHTNQAWDARAEAAIERDPFWINVAYSRCWVQFPSLRDALIAAGYDPVNAPQQYLPISNGPTL